MIAIAVAEISDPWGRTAQLKSRTVTAKKQTKSGVGHRKGNKKYSKKRKTLTITGLKYP